MYLPIMTQGIAMIAYAVVVDYLAKRHAMLSIPGAKILLFLRPKSSDQGRCFARRNDRRVRFTACSISGRYLTRTWRL